MASWQIALLAAPCLLFGGAAITAPFLLGFKAYDLISDATDSEGLGAAAYMGTVLSGFALIAAAVLAVFG
jgi:hypothetical protein